MRTGPLLHRAARVSATWTNGRYLALDVCEKDVKLHALVDRHRANS
jgi:hypothetical protein